jgi:hypothetical protein
VYQGCGEMDICGETLIGFVCAHCDAFEFLKLAVSTNVPSRA